MASQLGFLAFREKLHDCALQIRSDNLANVAALTKGSSHHKVLSAIARDTWTLAFEQRVSLSAVYLAGVQNTVADQLSRHKTDYSYFKLHPGLFRQLSDLFFQLEIDLFATAANTHLPAFFSLLPQPGATAVDAVDNTSGLRQPTVRDHGPGAAQGGGRSSHDLDRGTSLESGPVVAGADAPAHSRSVSSTASGRHLLTRFPGLADRIAVTPLAVDRSQYLRGALSTRGLSAGAVTAAQSTVRPATAATTQSTGDSLWLGQLPEATWVQMVDLRELPSLLQW
jgi:hypothetical protein